MWLLINIGCIECGVSSQVVGLFSSQERAEGLRATLNDKAGWREYGQNSYEVFPLPEAETINDEYLEYLTEETK